MNNKALKYGQNELSFAKGIRLYLKSETNIYIKIELKYKIFLVSNWTSGILNKRTLFFTLLDQDGEEIDLKEIKDESE